MSQFVNKLKVKDLKTRICGENRNFPRVYFEGKMKGSMNEPGFLLDNNS